VSTTNTKESKPKMAHSSDGSACNNPDCRNRHLQIKQRYKCHFCGNILHPAPLGCLQAVDDDSVIACLPGKGCKSHAGLASALAQSSMATSALQQSLLSFPTVDSLTSSDEDDDDEAKKPATMHPSSRDLATQSHRTARNITQGSPTVARARKKGKNMVQEIQHGCMLILTAKFGTPHAKVYDKQFETVPQSFSSVKPQ